MTNVLLSPDPTTASVLLQITAAPINPAAPLVEQRRNLIANPSLETNVTGFSIVGGSGSMTAVRDSTVGLYGTSSLKFVRTGDSGGGYLTSGSFPVTSGRQYTASVYVRCSANTSAAGYGDNALGIYFHDAALTDPQLFLGSYTATPVGGGWVRLTATATAPSSAVAAELQIFNRSYTTTLNLDGWLVEQSGSLQPYFDGSFTSPDSPYSTYGWTGTAHASASIYSARVGADGPLNVTRVDANGARTVRQLLGQTTINGSLTARDYEPALSGPIRYDVVDALGVTTSATVTLGASAPIVHVPVLPQYRALPRVVLDYSSARQNSSTAHEIVGRADPVVTKGPLRLRTGQLEFLALGHSEARNLEALAGTGEVLMLRQVDHPGMDQYFVADNVRLTPDQLTTDGRYWRVSMDTVEVAAPTSPLMGSVGWNLAAVASAFSSLGAIRSSYTTLGDLAAGPQS